MPTHVCAASCLLCIDWVSHSPRTVPVQYPLQYPLKTYGKTTVHIK